MTLTALQQLYSFHSVWETITATCRSQQHAVHSVWKTTKYKRITMALKFKDNRNSNKNNDSNTTAEQTMETVTGVDDETLNCCFQVMEAVSKLDPEQSQVLWCMFTDFVAAKNGIPAREIINTLVPLVVDVNDLMGPFFYDRYPLASDAPASPASPASPTPVNKAGSVVEHKADS